MLWSAMKKARFLLPVLALFTFSACVGSKHPYQPRPSKAKKSKQSSKNCHPSQYWDGNKCKHKGKGKGARKHDG